MIKFKRLRRAKRIRTEGIGDGRGNLISPAKLWKSSHFIVFATYKFYIPPPRLSPPLPPPPPSQTPEREKKTNKKKRRKEYKTVQLHIMRRTHRRAPAAVSLLKTENGTPRKMRPSRTRKRLLYFMIDT